MNQDPSPPLTQLRLERLLEAPIDALMVVDERGEVTMVNAHMVQIFGYSRDELLGKHMDFLIPERFRARHEHHHESYYADPHARPMGTGLDLLALRKDGSEFPVQISLTPLETDGQTLIAAAIRDVSDSKRAEQALRESERRLALHVEHTPLAVLEWETAGQKITAWNPSAERIFGYAAQDLIGKRSVDILVPDERKTQLEPLWRGQFDERNLRSTHHNLTRSGQTVICEWYSTALKDETGQTVRVAALVLDITARQRALEALLTAQEEERGRISRDLHDGVGQSLTATLLGLNELGSALGPERLEPLKRLTAQTLDDVRRISRDLRPALLDELGLKAALGRFARELSSQSGVDIDVLTRLPEHLDQSTRIVIYRVVQEALTNVVRHARAEHTSVIVTADEARIQLVVEDDGQGFDLSEVSTSKHVGLAGMRERLELLGGSLHIESAAGRGTTLSAHLPLSKTDSN